MSVTSVIALVAYSFTEEVVSLWNVADSNMALESEVNAAMDDLVKDFESAIFREDYGVMFAVEVLDDGDNSGNWDDAGSTSRPGAGAYDPAEDRYGWAGNWVRFFTAAPTVNAVSYQVVRREWYGNATKPQYRLYRSVVAQDYTIEAGFDLLDAGSDYFVGTANTGNAGVVLKTRQDEVVLNNVVDFGVRLYVQDPSNTDADEDAPVGLRLIFPSDGSDGLDDSDYDHYAITGRGSNDTVRYPEAAEIVVRVLGEDGAALLYELEEAGGSAAEWQAIVDDHSRVYRRFVDIRSRSI